MGVVYAAHDPELDRKVALKLVRAGARGSEERRRLLREAQAMARLAHPNVVAIFDVGEHSGEVFLAMELVDGETLRAWRAREHPWREVLGALVDAGRGLAAAHAKGLVHRDFKPDNVMIDGDGRVRVMDFGLARELVGDPDVAPSAAALAALADDAASPALTRTGALLGTPAYMAPEQFAGAATDARTDQFALCVTMWEALYGARPFAGGSTAALARAIQSGARQPPPRDVRLPRWLRAAIERGLATDPGDRWPSIDALLGALRRGQSRARRRRLGVGLVAVAALVAAAFAWDATRRSRAHAACARAGAAIGELWDDAARDRVRAGIEASEASYAATTAAKVTPWIDRFTATWSAARGELCVAAEIDGAIDEALYARGKLCLEGQVMELESLLDELGRADAQVVQRAVAAAAALSEVRSCSDPARLARLPQPPAAEEARLRRLRGDLSRASTLLVASKYAEGLSVVEAALADAEALAWPPLVAEAQLSRGALLAKLGRYDEAEAALEAAYFTAA
ncbi:MAG: serine/threonine-protein kinase, partial [Nannocystaceae bacterium]